MVDRPGVIYIVRPHLEPAGIVLHAGDFFEALPAGLFDLQTLGANPREIGLIYAAGGIAAAIIGLGAPMVSRRYGSLTAVLLIRGSSLPFHLLLVFAPWYALAIFAHVIRQVSINMAWPVNSTFISELVPGKLRVSVFGWRSVTWNFGIGLSSSDDGHRGDDRGVVTLAHAGQVVDQGQAASASQTLR